MKPPTKVAMLRLTALSPKLARQSAGIVRSALSSPPRSITDRKPPTTIAITKTKL